MPGPSTNAHSATYVYAANAGSGDISMYALDRSGGKLSSLGSLKLGDGVTVLTVSPDRRFLYAGIRGKDFSVATLAIDPLTGGLDPLSVAPLPDNMAYISVDATGRYFFGASYHGHAISVSPIGRDGFVQAEPVCVLRPGRHTHSIMADPSNRFVYVACLGNDFIAQYLFDERTGALEVNSPPVATAKQDVGPRHFCFSPNGRFVYVLNEMAGTVTTYVFDGKRGLLAEQGATPILPAGAAMDHGIANYYSAANIAMRAANPEKYPGNPKMWSADIHVSPDGKFVYASERAGSTITQLAADGVTGKLAFVKTVETEKQPRSFRIDPRGGFLVAAGEKSDHVSLHAISRENGELDLLGRYPAGKTPAWVEIVVAR